MQVAWSLAITTSGVQLPLRGRSVRQLNTVELHGADSIWTSGCTSALPVDGLLHADEKVRVDGTLEGWRSTEK